MAKVHVSTFGDFMVKYGVDTFTIIVRQAMAEPDKPGVQKMLDEALADLQAALKTECERRWG